jgi:Outer membrane protein and related peptidoglycan-associated (lipo)proteins
MVNKKYILLASLCSAFALQAVAQESSTSGAQWSGRDMTYRGQNYDVLDSSYIPKSRMKQQRKYLNHQYAFPAKPASMWEIGVGGGLYNVVGDVPTLMLWNKGGYGFHAHVRKAWGYTLSTRLQYIYGVAKGLDYAATGYTSLGSEMPYNGMANPNFNYYNSATNAVRNYRTEAHSLNFDLIASTNNIRFHKAKISASLYGFLGVGATAFKTYVNALDATYTMYDPVAVTGGVAAGRDNRKDFRTTVMDNMDDTYETVAWPADIDQTDRATILDDKLLAFTPSIGAGIQFRFSKRINLQIEDRYMFGGGEDLLDGHRWSNSAALSPGGDAINYFSLGLNFNLGNARKNVEPLYWVNPLDHAYNELSYPRHMILPNPVLPDSDGDGVTDQFDKCPGTAAGVAVDVHGCPMDTDGDGVPDDRDKQLITPTECQPVDADGVGKCPCPDGCGTVASACGNIGAGSITFDNNAAKIRPASAAQLATLAAQMQANPTCKVVITGSGNGSKIQQQRSWDRVNAIIEYMSEKNGISRDRFIFQYGQAGDPNSVMYRSAMPGEEGPANVAPPFPNLQRN